jgi:hypothetical protein
LCAARYAEGNRKISQKLMRELPAGSVVMTYVFRLPAEEWDAHLVGAVRVEIQLETRSLKAPAWLQPWNL